MSAKDIWYGVLEAGEKTSPVVRDATLEASQNKIYLYNHARNQFIEYAKAIVEPKLRELAEGDIPRDELDKAFKATRKAFTASRQIRTWAATPPPAQPVKNEDEEDSADFDISDDDDIEDFIDDD